MVPINELATLIAHKAYEQKKDPNKVFLEVMKKYPHATEEHRKRVIEKANKKLFHLYYKDGVYEFPVIDPKVVLSGSGQNDTLAKAAATSAGVEPAFRKAAGEEFEAEINPGDFILDGSFASESVSAVGGYTYEWFETALRQNKTASKEEDETVKEYERLQKVARVEELLSGRGGVIPALSVIRPYVDEQVVQNLEFKKQAGAREDVAMARELLQLLAELSAIEEGGD